MSTSSTFQVKEQVKQVQAEINPIAGVSEKEVEVREKKTREKERERKNLEMKKNNVIIIVCLH